MTLSEIISKLKEQNFPKGSYVVYGSGPLAAAGIREANDIDLLVSASLLDELKLLGWQLVDKGPKDKPYTRDVFEAHKNWDFSSYSPTLNDLLKTATIIDDVPFASLVEVRKWKTATGGERHLADIKLIDKYLKDSINETSSES